MILLQLVYLMLPAYVANMAPVFARRLSFLNNPIDAGKTWRGQRLFGAHKTWRGLVIGVVAGTLVAGLQSLLVSIVPSWNILSYEQWYVVGFLLSFGALGGDLLKSFFKRRAGITSGKAWIPFDQLDYAIGALALLSLHTFVGWTNVLLILVISVVLHILTNFIGYYLNIRKQPW